MTAVEWLVSELKKSLPSIYNNEFDEEIQQAKEMEKQQIIDAYKYDNCYTLEHAEQYYNEQLKKQISYETNSSRMVSRRS